MAQPHPLQSPGPGNISSLSSFPSPVHQSLGGPAWSCLDSVSALWFFPRGEGKKLNWKPVLHTQCWAFQVSGDTMHSIIAGEVAGQGV